MRDTALVVPSIRKDSFERFVREWESTGLFDRVDLILMEDNPVKTFSSDLFADNNRHIDPSKHVHLSWEDIDKQEWASIIPRRSDTVRSFAYWYAWNAGYEYIMTMDDDCYPAPGYEELDLLHKSMLTRTKWFNTLNSVRPRGTPYFNVGERRIHVNHGLWLGVLDYDGPQQLVNPIPEVYSHDNRIIPSGAYHSFCGMNAMWRRDAMVLSYHMLMGQMFVRKTKGAPGMELEKLPFDRFGDIWCGIVQKKILDEIGWAISTGTPYIHHDRASNPFTNLRKEANGIEVNEWFWQKIDEIDLSAIHDPGQNKKNQAAMYYSFIGEFVMDFGGEHAVYWDQLGKAMITWAELFENIDRR